MKILKMLWCLIWTNNRDAITISRSASMYSVNHDYVVKKCKCGEVISSMEPHK